MDATELAMRMLTWEKAQRNADKLKAEIMEAVMELGKTQTVGHVRATYSAGRKSYNYEEGWRSAWATAEATEDLDQMAKLNDVAANNTAPATDWRTACSEANIEAPFKQGAPSVSVKLLDN